MITVRVKRRFGLFIASVFAVLISVVILVGLGVGYFVNYLFPAIDVASAAIVGVLAFGVAVHCVLQLMGLTTRLQLGTQDEDYEDEDVDPELISDEQMEAMADQVSEAVIMKLGSWGNRRSASSRHRR